MSLESSCDALKRAHCERLGCHGRDVIGRQLCITDVTNEHFVPGLLPPSHLLTRIGVGGISRRVIESAGTKNFGSRRNSQRFSKTISRLPVEVETGYREQRLAPAIRIAR